MSFSGILDKFEICLKINKELKEVIEIFHVFDDRKGYNVLFITRDDKVFSFGSNRFGCCGLGHNSVVNEPQVIHELCNKNIKQFFIGLDFVLALSSDHQLYGWGQNNFGQLGRSYDQGEFFRPELIIIPNDTIIEVSCGASHSLAITAKGNVYGWGANTKGQIGCGAQITDRIEKPFLLKCFTKLSIKSISCSWHRSYALTSDGLVYSWGFNDWCHLGHELNKNECVFEPKLIDNISKITSLCPTGGTMNFLTNEGLIYFCGFFRDENNCESYQKSPKLLNCETKFSSLHSVPYYQKQMTIASAVCRTPIKRLYRIYRDVIEKTDKHSLFSLYCEKFKISYKTIALNDNRFECINRFEEMFSNTQELGSGGFGTVYKVTNVFDGKIFAIKKILIEEMTQKTNEELIREVNTLYKCSAEYVVQFFDSWIENNSLYIQMELCSDNLNNVIKGKAEYFKRDDDQPMTSIEYFISCQLFKELLECVQYLHESNPPIIHRDLKPENILICDNQRNGRYLKIGDFGSAKFDTLSVVSHTKFTGTQKYMAPEVWYSTKYNIKADIYSLSVIIQDMFEYNIYSPEIIIDNNYLSNKWSALKDMISSMMISPQYNARPTCAQLLSNFSEWSLSPQELLESDFIYSQTFIENNNFFNKFFISKLLSYFYPGHFLSENILTELLNNSDITFVVNNEEIHCIRLLLMLKSQEFKQLLKDLNLTKFIITDLSLFAFKLMIHFIYFDEIKFEDQTRDHSLLIEVYKCVEKYKIAHLMKSVACSLIDIENIEQIFQFGKQYNLEDVIELSRQFLEVNFEKVVKLNITKIIQINTLTDNYLIELFLSDRLSKDNLIEELRPK